MKLSEKRVARAKARIPQEDFAGAGYDTDNPGALAKIIIILSSPRSGSTFLCDLFHINGICLPHEYFQPQEYLPLLADRWGCRKGEDLDGEAYVQALTRYRTSSDGTLGINLHGSHLAGFLHFEPLLAGLPVDFVVVQRRDIIAQAISHEIAGQTQRWSSAFASSGKPEYRFDAILARVRNLQRQNLLTQAFANARRGAAADISYEDLVADTEQTLRKIPAFANLADIQIGTRLKRQGSDLNSQWKRQFAEECLSRNDLMEFGSKGMARVLHKIRGR